jgi:hypothetical protein
VCRVHYVWSFVRGFFGISLPCGMNCLQYPGYHFFLLRWSESAPPAPPPAAAAPRRPGPCSSRSGALACGLGAPISCQRTIPVGRVKPNAALGAVAARGRRRSNRVCRCRGHMPGQPGPRRPGVQCIWARDAAAHVRAGLIQGMCARVVFPLIRFIGMFAPILMIFAAPNVWSFARPVLTSGHWLLHHRRRMLSHARLRVRTVPGRLLLSAAKPSAAHVCLVHGEHQYVCATGTCGGRVRRAIIGHHQ